MCSHAHRLMRSHVNPAPVVINTRNETSGSGQGNVRVSFVGCAIAVVCEFNRESAITRAPRPWSSPTVIPDSSAPAGSTRSSPQSPWRTGTHQPRYESSVEITTGGGRRRSQRRIRAESADEVEADDGTRYDRVQHARRETRTITGTAGGKRWRNAGAVQITVTRTIRAPKTCGFNEMYLCRKPAPNQHLQKNHKRIQRHDGRIEGEPRSTYCGRPACTSGGGNRDDHQDRQTSARPCTHASPGANSAAASRPPACEHALKNHSAECGKAKIFIQARSRYTAKAKTPGP